MLLVEQLDGSVLGGRSEAERKEDAKGNEEHDAGIPPAAIIAPLLAATSRSCGR